MGSFLPNSFASPHLALDQSNAHKTGGSDLPYGNPRPFDEYIGPVSAI
jgi:hypothetical protein